MELNLESVALKTDCVTFKDIVKGECKTEIDSSTVSKILGIYVKTVNSDSDLIDNQIKYKSQVIYSICYIDNEKKVRKFECGGEIAGDIANVNIQNGYVKLRVNTEKTEGDISGLHLVIKAIFNVVASVFYQEKNNFVLNGENLICKKSEHEYFRSYGRRKTIFPIEEEFSVNYNIQNVLNHKITPIITGVQCGVGTIIVDGEVYISALVLQNDEKCDIIREQKVIPFRAELEYEECMPSMFAICEATERSFKTDISVDEEKGESTIVASISLILEGEAYSPETVELCDDVFSLEKDLLTEVKVCDMVKPLESKSITQEVKCSSVNLEGVEEQKLIAVGYDRVEVVDAKYVKDCIMVSGVVSFVALFKNEQGEITFRRVDSDFSTSLDMGENVRYNVYGNLLGLDVRKTNGNLDIGAKINFCVCGEIQQKVKLIQSIEEVGDKKKETASISVYIALENEELWSLAKRLNTAPEEICEINKELQFPLTGKERIVIYRQK